MLPPVAPGAGANPKLLMFLSNIADRCLSRRIPAQCLHVVRASVALGEVAESGAGAVSVYISPCMAWA